MKPVAGRMCTAFIGSGERFSADDKVLIFAS